MSNNTVFKKKVNVKYGNQTIDAEILNLNFKNNLIEIIENVFYVNENTKIKADKVEIDLLDKKPALDSDRDHFFEAHSPRITPLYFWIYSDVL